MNPLAFTAWLLLASWQIGVPMVPVLVDDRDAATSWASMYVYKETGAPAYYVATPELLVYGVLVPEYLRLVAYHEVCHNLDDVGAAEDAANACTAQAAGVSLDEVHAADAAAHAWCVMYCPEGVP